MEYNVVDELQAIVAKVSTKLLPSLQLFDPAITGVHFEHGHIIEIVETLRQKSTTTEHTFQRYPLVALLHDFPEERNTQIGIDATVKLHILIVRSTIPTYKASQRLVNNFKPVLHPVYNELMEQLRLSPVFLSYLKPKHSKTDRFYWGRQGVLKNEANIFNDWVDCVEIKDLILKVKQKTC